MNVIDSPFVDVRVSWQPVPHRSSSHLAVRLPTLLFLTLIALVLNGCGSADRSYGYADRPPSNRTAYVAWEEWSRFGRSTVVYGGHAGGYVNRSGLSEHSEPLNSRVGDYWGTCGHPEWNGRTVLPGRHSGKLRIPARRHDRAVRPEQQQSLWRAGERVRRIPAF